MKVEFIDRSGFKNIASVGFPDRTACISISSTHEDWREMVGISKRSKANIKCLRFLDIDSKESGFTRRTAELLKEFVDDWMICEYEHRPKRILIHCDMGVSRSGAIAKWINDYYGLDDRYLNEYYQHNKYVYDTLMSVCGVSLKDWYREIGKQQ